MQNYNNTRNYLVFEELYNTETNETDQLQYFDPKNYCPDESYETYEALTKF